MPWTRLLLAGPVGEVLDNRDSKLRSRLSMVKDNSAELDKLQKEAEAVLKARSRTNSSSSSSRGAA